MLAAAPSRACRANQSGCREVARESSAASPPLRPALREGGASFSVSLNELSSGIVLQDFGKRAIKIGAGDPGAR